MIPSRKLPPPTDLSVPRCATHQMQYNNASCKGNRKLSVYQLPHERAVYPSIGSYETDMLENVGGRGLSHELAGNLQRNMRELCRKGAPLGPLREKKCRRASCGADVN